MKPIMSISLSLILLYTLTIFAKNGSCLRISNDCHSTTINTDTRLTSNAGLQCIRGGNSDSESDADDEYTDISIVDGSANGKKKGSRTISRSSSRDDFGKNKRTSRKSRINRGGRGNGGKGSSSSSIYSKIKGKGKRRATTDSLISTSFERAYDAMKFTAFAGKKSIKTCIDLVSSKQVSFNQILGKWKIYQGML